MVEFKLNNGYHIVEVADKKRRDQVISDVSVFELYRVLQSNKYSDNTMLLANGTGDYNTITFMGAKVLVIEDSDIVAECTFPNK